MIEKYKGLRLLVRILWSITKEFFVVWRKDSRPVGAIVELVSKNKYAKLQKQEAQDQLDEWLRAIATKTGSAPNTSDKKSN